MSRVIIGITTYNRPELLQRLVENIHKEFQVYNKSQEHQLRIRIYNDFSPQPYDAPLKYLTDNKIDHKYHLFGTHQGKKKYWSVINLMYSHLRKEKYDYFIQLPDDVTLKDNFFEKAITQYNLIPEKNKICLNLLLDEARRGKANWTRIKPTTHQFNGTTLYNTAWVDLCFIATENYLKALNYNIRSIRESIWDEIPAMGSGVGKQISERLYTKYSLWQVSESLVIHGDHKSEMNEQERLRTPLIAI